jgi:integrase
MKEEIELKVKMKDRRFHLNDKLCRELPIEEKAYSKGDDTVIGFRIFVNAGGTKVFKYVWSEKGSSKRNKEGIGIFPNINCIQARNKAKVIAAEVLEGKSPSQIRKDRSNELGVAELMTEYVEERLKEPKYKISTQERWKHFNNAWIYENSNDPIIKAMFAKSKLGIGSLKLSEVNMKNLRPFHRWVGSKSPNSANSLVEMLGVIFKYAAEQSYISKSPVQFKTEDLFEKKERNQRLTKTQMDAVINYALRYDERGKDRLNIASYKADRYNPVSCCVIVKALLDAKRFLSEGAEAKWNEISFHEKLQYCGDSKVGQKQYKMGPKVLKLMSAIRNERFNKGSPFCYPPEDERSKYVFPSYNFEKINNVGKVNDKPYISNVNKTWRRILKDLKIDYLPTYNCRHSKLTHALSKTKSIPIVGEMAGHSKKSGYKSTLRYTRILGEDVEEAWNIIDGEETITPKVIQLKK